MTGVRFELFVIGHPRDFQINHLHVNGFLSDFAYSFQALQTFLLKRSSQKTFLIPKFLIHAIN